jgi:hypothetical protein
MEPIRQTTPNLIDIQEELIRHEPLFHRPELGRTRQALEAMTAEDFWETGASGRRYSREFVIDTVLQRFSTKQEEQWTTEDFFCQQIAPGHYLLTYTLHQGPRVTRRASLWRHMQDRWIAVYHQGTLVAGDI